MTEAEKNLIISLTKTYSSAFTLYYLTHNCHWDVMGQPFYEMHKMLQKQYEDIFESIDDLAEKIRQLDAFPPSSLLFVTKISIPYEDCSKFEVSDMAISLAESNVKFTHQLNESILAAKAIGREDIVNFLAERWEQHSKYRWMLRATGQKIHNEKTENL
jgi:starvation-inducible DNA-binding protein